MRPSVDYDFVAAFCRENWGGMCEHIIRIADDACENVFLFDLPWDMERTLKKTVFEREIDWSLKRDGDPEYLFQMNRHRFFLCLAQAYRLTGDERYPDCLVRLMADWIERVPRPEKQGNHPWRSLETGLRCGTWTKALKILAGSPVLTEDFLKRYKSSLREHAELLMVCHDSHKELSNWGVIQDCGLFAAGLELGERRYVETALTRLYGEARLQLMADGVHWEQSCLYHNEVLRCFLDVILRAQGAGILLEPDFYERARSMALANIAWLKPNRRQPLLGDSDYTDLRDLLSQSALLFREPRLRALAFDRLDFESAWLVGERGIRAYDALKKELPAFTSIALRDSGNLILRSGWETDADWLMLHNGYTGGGHSHEDKLSFELTVGGRDVLTDCGRGTYVWGRERRYLKSYLAHNTVFADGRHFVRALNWGYTKLAPSLKQELVEEEDFALLSGTQLGYMKGIFGAVVTRKILWLKPDVYIVADILRARGLHRWGQCFNFAPGGKLELSGDGAVYTAGETQTIVRFLTEGLRVRMAEGLYSEHYNKIEKIDALRTSFFRVGDAFALTVFVGDAGGKYKNVKIEKARVTRADGGALPERPAQGIVLTLDGVRYTVVLAFREFSKELLCDGKPAAGTICYYKNDEYHIVEW